MLGRRCVWAGLVLLTLGWLNAECAEPRRILLLHSFGREFEPFNTFSQIFRSELARKSPQPVDFFDVALGGARFESSDEDPFVDYLNALFEGRRLDLVVPMGAPAVRFAQNHRQQLFPNTPMLLTSVDQRMLQDAILTSNDAVLAVRHDPRVVTEAILRLLPDTTNLVVAFGNSRLEKFWTEETRQAVRPLVGVEFFSDLSFEQMKKRAASLPPHSVILYGQILVDANGIPQAQDALVSLQAVANVPIFGIHDYQLGRGIVGGPLIPVQELGRHGAQAAVRILRGESPATIRPPPLGPGTPTYDWRELRRWHIAEANLPPGSTVLFREPSLWQKYWGEAVWILVLVVFQALVISLLLTNLMRRRRAERSLAESEARFQTAANTSPVMIWTTGPDKLCTFVNQKWLDFTGRTLEQELEYGWADGIHPNDAAACLKAYEESFDARREFTFQYRLRSKNSDYAWMLDKGTPRYASDGTFLGYVGSMTDISALKQAEERWRSVVDGAPNAMVVVDGDGKITLVNARVEAVFRYHRSQLLGQPAEMLIPESSRRRFEELRQRYMARPSQSSLGEGYKILGRRSNGSQISLEIGLSPIRTPEGQFVLASMIDITERVAAEESLRESEQRMSLAADAAHLGMWVWNAPDTYMWASEKWRAINGYASDEDIRYDALVERVHREDRAAAEQAIADAINTQGAFHLELRIVLPDGTVRWLNKSGRVEQLPNNGPLRVLGITIDITARKQSEEAALEVSGKLITAQEDERKRIARDLHDDLNQRLALLSVETDLLGRMENNAPAQALIKDIAARVRDLSSEVHKLSYQLHPAKLDQLGLVSATRSFCQELHKQCGVAVEFRHDYVPRDLDRDVALCLYRIVQESLQNMVKHSQATQAQVHLKREAEGLWLVVHDNGQGFDTEMANHHAGLGLVSMRERVRLLHGQITIHSAPGLGTRVEVRIPTGAEAAVA